MCPESIWQASSSPECRTSEIFIENGRFHGQLIAADLKRNLHAELKKF